MIDNTIEITDFSSQSFKLYLTQEVNEELKYKIQKNFSAYNTRQRERAEALFRHINHSFYNIANGIMIDGSNTSRDGELLYDVFEDICTIIFQPVINDQKELGFIITNIIWKYQTNSWWNIVENKDIDRVITETINRYINKNCSIC